MSTNARRIGIGLSILLFASFAEFAYATPITYSFTFTATGIAGIQSFSNAPITIVLTGDTSGITRNALDITRNPVTGTITIGGVGAGNITDSISASSACAANPQIGIERAPFGLLPSFLFTGFTIPHSACGLNASASAAGLTPANRISQTLLRRLGQSP